MIDTINEIAQQARQGSVAAIIQILNEQLADVGVRTRAVLHEGVLQLLCEGATTENLNQAFLVERIREILEAIAPQNFRRVKINSRIAREQQLLWLEDINRNPQTQLLWAEEITLKRANFLEKFRQKPKERKTVLGQNKELLGLTSRKPPSKSFFWEKLIGGIGVGLLFILVLIVIYNRLTEKTMEKVNSNKQIIVSPSSNLTNTMSIDPFSQAVRLANQAAQDGQTAKSYGKWVDLANKWQQASDLMNKVPSSHPRYQEAQTRVINYRKNSEMALTKAKSTVSN